MGEGSGGERKRAEYSAAVSRLADSAYSCSECATRGRQKNGVKEQNSAGMQPRMHACFSVQMSSRCHLGKDRNARPQRKIPPLL